MGGIIWIASYPKSGNTWMRAFIHNLLRNPDEPYNINQITDFTLGDSQAHLYAALDPKPVTAMTREEVARLRPRVHKAITQLRPDSIFVKTHNALIADQYGIPLVTLEATAGAIYIVRNPLDVAVSYSHHLGFTLDDTIAAMARKGASTDNNEKNVYEVMGSWTENVLSWTQVPNPRLHVVRYEDMLDAPNRTFGGVAAFLRLKPPKERLDKAIKLSSFKVLKEQERRHGFIEKSPRAQAFFREGKAEQWRKVLTHAQVAAIVAAHREQMTRFGYVPPGF